MDSRREACTSRKPPHLETAPEEDPGEAAEGAIVRLTFPGGGWDDGRIMTVLPDVRAGESVGYGKPEGNTGGLERTRGCQQKGAASA